MVRRTDPAILEIGRFSRAPTIDDLRDLTLENRDIEDLRRCVPGDCKLKLSAAMIERFQKEIDWTAPDYRSQATQLFKHILLDYVREYLRQGDDALIRYDDKMNPVEMANETRSLMTASSVTDNISTDLKPNSNSRSQPSLIEDAIVWSKIKFGLKPVTAINHIAIFRQDEQIGPQILIVSKQIYANHYFDASVAVTAFGRIPGRNSGAYLFYENRSSIDGLNGLFGKLKREVIENQAVDSLQAFLEKSQASLNARMNIKTVSDPMAPAHWNGWTLLLKVCLWTFLISAFVMLVMVGSHQLKNVPSARHLRLASTETETFLETTHGRKTR